jgi:mercuric reductase
MASTSTTKGSLPSYAVRPGVTIPDWSVVVSTAAERALRTLMETDHILRRWSGYTLAEDLARRAVLDFYRTHGHAPAISDLSSHLRIDVSVIRALLFRLRERDLVLFDAEKDMIVGAYPFTDRDTDHLVKLNGRDFNAMCAVDALGIGDMCRSDIQVASRCRMSLAPISIATRRHGREIETLQPQTAVVWLRLGYTGGCAASSLCAETAFFRSDDDLTAWRNTRHSDSPGIQLSIPEALEVGRAIFRKSLVTATLNIG